MGFTTQGLLSNQGVRAGAAGMDFIINQMVQLQVVGKTYGYRVIEGLAGTAIIQNGLSGLIDAGQLQSVGNILLVCTVEYGHGDLHCLNALVAEFINFYGLRHAVFFYVIAIFSQALYQALGIIFNLHA